MGRYYNGDIEGKFWFGVQSSDDADFFGCAGKHPEELIYYFDKDEHGELIAKGIEACTSHLGEYKEKIDKFFEKENGYNDEIMSKVLDLSEREVKSMLVWYARLDLGSRIKKCVDETGSCNFTAEC